MNTFNQALDKAADLVKTQAKNLTEAGQTVQAASTISRMSPEGILHYINKIARDAGTDLKLPNEKTFDFMRKAEEIQNILDPRERAFKTFDLIDELADSIPRGGKDKLLEALNLPRSIMATADLSAPFRQGIFTAARNPKMFAKNFGKMFKYAFSEKAYRNLKADIITSPNYNLYQKYKDYGNLYYKYWFNELYEFKKWLQQIVLLQSFFKVHKKPYLMLNTTSNNLSLWLQPREKFINATKSLLDFFDYLNDDQLLNEHLQIQELNSLINQSTFIEWNRWSIADLRSSYPCGKGGHLLEDGHQKVANKVVKYYNKTL
jgi:hypothetical protein